MSAVFAIRRTTDAYTGPPIAQLRLFGTRWFLVSPRTIARQEQGKLFATFVLAPEQSYLVPVLRMWRNPPGLPSIGHFMSPILPISFVATLLCVLIAIDWALYQQILFVGAAPSATVWVCSLEAWSTQVAARQRR